MNVILKNNDDSYFYLYKQLCKKSETKYLDKVNNLIINNLILSKIDSYGYINDTLVNIEEIIKNNKINKILLEEETFYAKKILDKYNISYNVVNKSNFYISEINKLKNVILLRLILDDNKESIYNMKFLILGDNTLSYCTKELFTKLNISYDSYNKDLIELIELNKYDCIINASNLKINPELLFNLKKELIIYDLAFTNSKLDFNILDKNMIKYRFVNNVSLYLPIAKANLLYEVMCEYGCI